jgi:SAM-dependent methyltransferase
MTQPRLTGVAHAALGGVLRPGDCAVDATLGNGHDALFMARCVGPGGRVIGFDVQEAALAATRAAAEDAGLATLLELHLCGHESMARVLGPARAGRVAAVTFNLGYLPGGDKSLVTRPHTTAAALEQAGTLLRPGGLVSLLVYRGHAGASAEVGAVDDWLARLDAGWEVTRHDSPGPVLYLVARRA